MRSGIGHWALGIGHWALGIGHWSLVKRLSKEIEVEKGRKGERRQETGDSFAEIGLTICDLEFGVWDFSHLAVLGALGGLIF